MKTNLYSQFKTDSDSEKEGIWFQVMPGVRFLIRRMGGSNTVRIKEITARNQKPLARKIQAGVATDEELNDVVLKTFIEGCIVGWEGIKDEHGEPVPFTLENAFEVLKPLEDLSETLLKYASNFSNYREDVGNF